MDDQIHRTQGTALTQQLRAAATPSRTALEQRTYCHDANGSTPCCLIVDDNDHFREANDGIR